MKKPSLTLVTLCCAWCLPTHSERTAPPMPRKMSFPTPMPMIPKKKGLMPGAIGRPNMPMTPRKPGAMPGPAKNHPMAPQRQRAGAHPMPRTPQSGSRQTPKSVTQDKTQSCTQELKTRIRKEFPHLELAKNKAKKNQPVQETELDGCTDTH